ncbi:MAG: hypothetical protein Ct9H300mP1_29650 [Planctomycetaceae bacterium]|nr:MAG: hypothetical protein Ct9H300mP1_29650 [Planctomycetaceae bacterium]
MQDAQGQPTPIPPVLWPATWRHPAVGRCGGSQGLRLGFLVELLGSTLAGLRCDDPETGGNGVCFLVIDPGRFVDPSRTGNWLPVPGIT